MGNLAYIFFCAGWTHEMATILPKCLQKANAESNSYFLVEHAPRMIWKARDFDRLLQQFIVEVEVRLSQTPKTNRTFRGALYCLLSQFHLEFPQDGCPVRWQISTLVKPSIRSLR